MRNASKNAGQVDIPFFISVLFLIALAHLAINTNANYYSPLIIVLAVLGTIFVFVAMNSRREDLAIFIALGISLVLRGPLNVIANISILDFLMGAVLLTFLLQLINRKSEFSHWKLPTPVLVAMVFMLASEILGVFLYPAFITQSYKILANFVEFILIFFMVLRYCRTVEHVERLLKYAAIIGIGAIIITAWEILFGIFHSGQYYTIFGNKDILSFSVRDVSRGYIAMDTHFLLPISVTLWYGIFRVKPKIIGFGLATAALIILAVSTRRTIFLAVLAFIFALFWLNNRKYALIIIILSMAVASLYVFSNPQLNDFGDVANTWNRIVSGQWISGQVSSTTVRFNLYVIAVRLSLTHPFWGYGMGGFAKEIYLNPSVASLAYDPTNLLQGTVNATLSAHSQYLQILLDYGIIVFAIFMAFVWTLIKRSYLLSNYKDGRISSLARVLFICQAGWAIANVFEVNIHATNLKSMFFYVSAALILALWKIAKDDRSKPVLVSNLSRTSHKRSYSREHEALRGF